MPDVRPINQEKYDISKHKFLEVYHHCMQYQEWQSELKCKKDTIQGTGYAERVQKSAPTGSSTEQLAIRRMELHEKCKLIEQTAMEADADLYPYILEGVTKEYATFWYLHDAKGIPCSRNTYYDRRKKFYWLLSKKI